MSLLERAAVLVPLADIDLALETDLTEALFWVGRVRDAAGRAGSLAERAAAAGDQVAELCGRINERLFRAFIEPEGATEQLAATVDQALPLFEAAGDDLALYIGYVALGWVANWRARMDALLEAYERAAAHAQRAGLPYEFLGWRAAGRLGGTTPVTEVLAWLDEQEARGVRDPWLRVPRAVSVAGIGCRIRPRPTAGGLKMVVVPTSPSTAYVVEARQHLGRYSEICQGESSFTPSTRRSTTPAARSGTSTPPQTARCRARADSSTPRPLQQVAFTKTLLPGSRWLPRGDGAYDVQVTYK